MDFSYSKTEELFLQMVRSFAENEVKPLAAEIDEQERFPLETVQKMGKLGMMGIPIPKQYGGAGGTVQMYIMAVEELSRVCATTGVVLSAHTSLCMAPILEHGTEEQKMKYLPKLASGEWIGAFGLTEPNAGTDAAMQQTTAVDAGDHWVLNGSKIFITNASNAHVFIVMAMTDKSQGTKGISAFIVERDMPGFSIGKKELKMGIRGSATCELIFENCIVPKENLLGQLGKGFKIAMMTLDGGRIGIASQARDREVHQGAQAVWPRYRQVPEHPVPDGRPQDQGRGCPSAGAQCRMEEGHAPALQRRCRYGQALCCRDSYGGNYQGRTVPRWLWLHP